MKKGLLIIEFRFIEYIGFRRISETPVMCKIIIYNEILTSISYYDGIQSCMKSAPVYKS